MTKDIEIVYKANKIITVKAPVIDSHHATLLAQSIDNLPYMTVEDRAFDEECNKAKFKCKFIDKTIVSDVIENDIDEINALILMQYEENTI